MSKTMRARYDSATGEVQIFMSLEEFKQLQTELNNHKVETQLRTVGVVGEWLRGMCSSLWETMAQAGDHLSLSTAMTGWWHTPNR